MTAAVLQTLPPDIRARCEATIERLIAFLDQFEPDVDLEDDGEAGRPTALDDMSAAYSEDSEPSLGSSESATCDDRPSVPARKALRNHSLKSLERNGKATPGARKSACGLTPFGDQSLWGQGGAEDCELDTSDDEPSLGAPEQPTDDIAYVNGRWIDIEPDQTAWAAGVRDDREGDLADTADDRERDECDRGELG